MSTSEKSRRCLEGRVIVGPQIRALEPHHVHLPQLKPRNNELIHSLPEGIGRRKSKFLIHH